jgi:uncharacterized membrane protein YadS
MCHVLHILPLSFFLTLCVKKGHTEVHNKVDFYLPTYVLTNLLTYLLSSWRRVLLEKLTGFQLVNKFPAFMEPKSS